MKLLVGLFVIVLQTVDIASINCYSCAFQPTDVMGNITFDQFKQVFGLSSSWQPQVMDDATRCLNPTKKESCDGPCLTYGFMAKTGVTNYNGFIRGCSSSIQGHKRKVINSEGGMDYCEHGVWPMSKNNKMKAYIRYCDLDGCNRDRNYIADCEHTRKCYLCQKESDGGKCSSSQVCTSGPWCNKIYAEGTGSTDGKTEETNAGSQYDCSVNPTGISQCVKPDKDAFLALQKGLGDPGVVSDSKAEICFCNNKDLCNSATLGRFSLSLLGMMLLAKLLC